MVGKALLDGQLLDAYFTRTMYKQMLGLSPNARDLESIDPECAFQIQRIAFRVSPHCLCCLPPSRSVS